VFGRLAPGVTPARAATETDQAFRTLERDAPTEYVQAGAQVTRLGDVFLGPVRPVLLALWAGVAALLLVACGNVAHLLLLRASERSEEIAVRAALGVTRARLVRQFLTESVLLALAGGAGGLAVAWAAIRVVAARGPDQIPRLGEAALTGGVIGVGVVLTLASGIAFGLVPLGQVRRHASGGLMRSRARRSESSSAWRARAALISANVALAVLLLVGSGLLVRSLRGLLAVAPGVEASGVLTFTIWATGDRFRAGEPADQIAAAVRFYDDVLERARALPGVTDASAVTTLPLGGGNDQYGFHVQGRPADPTRGAPMADRFVVTPGFFATLRIPLVRGRLLDDRDRQGSEAVAVVSESTARSVFAGEDPLGQRVSLGPASAPPRTIVGVVADVRHGGLDVPVGPQVYVPQAQWAWAETFLTVLVRTSGDPAAVSGPMRDVVRAVDPMQPVARTRLYSDVIAASIGTRRFAATLLTGFAVTSVVMAMVGLYGSVAVVVAQRRREIGVRLALGATLGRIRALILAQGLKPVLAGLAAGVIVAAASVRALDSMLYGVTAFDALTFLGAVAGLGVCALLACLAPAARAARIDPAATLRD
jgi:putative ABC transport system permease protein